MEDIWNRMIQDPATVRFRQADFFSPYCESVVDSIRRLPDGNDEITMNTFYRYDDIFLSLFEQNDISEMTRDWLLDCMMHLLTRLELRNGVNRQEYQLRTKWQEIEQGAYGNNMKELFYGLSQDNRYLAAWFLVQQERNGESVTLFSRALVGMLQDGVIYKNDENPKELILYMGKAENEQDSKIMEFAREAYLPFDYQIRVFWNHSFGIVEDDRCMRIEDIEIF